MTARKRISRKEDLLLRKYYSGKRCVVTGNEQQLYDGDYGSQHHSIDYHHLDDDHRNSMFSNIVPISHHLNSAILQGTKKRLEGRKRFIIDGEIDPEKLRLVAREWFLKWRVPLAYGCSRLAYFIAKNYLRADLETLTTYACSALYYARHSFEYRLVQDILTRDITPIAQSGKISTKARAQIYQELAGLMSENGYFVESSAIFDMISNDVIAEIGVSNFESHAGLLRRKATSIIAQNGSASDVKGLLGDAREVGLKRPNILVSVNNSEAWAFIYDGNYKAAYELLHPIIEQQRQVIFNGSGRMKSYSNTTGWNAGELFHSYGIAACHMGGKYVRRGTAALKNAIDIFNLSRSRPFQLQTGFWQVEYDNLMRNGVEITPLQAEPISPEILSLIRYIVRNL